MSVPDQLAPLAALVGVWEGEGRGVYPTIETFSYRERLEISVGRKPVLSHVQRTELADGSPSHAEVGFWRVPAPDRVELLVAHPSGIAEVCVGGVDDDGTVHVRSTSVVATASAKPVETLERWYRVDGDELTYRLSMGAVCRPHQHHLDGVLRRVR